MEIRQTKRLVMLEFEYILNAAIDVAVSVVMAVDMAVAVALAIYLAVAGLRPPP